MSIETRPKTLEDLNAGSRLTKLESNMEGLCSQDVELKSWLNKTEKNLDIFKGEIRKDLAEHAKMSVDIEYIKLAQDELKNTITAKLIDQPHQNYNDIKNYVAMAVVGGVIGYLVNLVLK